MTLIKLLLLGGILLAGLLAFRGGHGAGSRAFGRLLAVGVLTAGATGVVFPDLVTGVAGLVGVGRGADLVLYVVAVALLLVTVVLLRRIGDLEQRYVALARRVAIDDAERRAVAPVHLTPVPRD